MAERILSENGMFAETYRGDRPEPFNSCILQAWSVGMYTYALREMMLGMKMNMIENKIHFEPQIPESLRNNFVPINFEHVFQTAEGLSRFQVLVDANSEKISIRFKNIGANKAPEILSNTYSIDIKN